jgi:methyltransferase (TIGR00027 family)
MKTNQPSGTAMGTAAVRAIESEKSAGERICFDPLARRLTGPVFYSLIKLLAGYGERRTHGALTFIVCRCRYIDDYLRDCLKTGTSQVVILGAGLDSRAYRDGLGEAEIKFFEVDHPATQTNKIERLKKIFGKVPENVVYVPVDFNEETLDKLLSFDFDPSRKAVFVWEGVTFYLNPEAVDATLAWVRKNASAGSAIIFDYQYASAPSVTQTQRNFLYSVISRVSGERRSFGIEKGRIEDFLARKGFSRVVDADAGRLERLYCIGPNRDRRVPESYAIVHAEVEK